MSTMVGFLRQGPLVSALILYGLFALPAYAEDGGEAPGAEELMRIFDRGKNKQEGLLLARLETPFLKTRGADPSASGLSWDGPYLPWRPAAQYNQSSGGFQFNWPKVGAIALAVLLIGGTLAAGLLSAAAMGWTAAAVIPLEVTALAVAAELVVLGRWIETL